MQWLTKIVERHANGWERAYEDILAGSDLPEENRADLRRRVERAGSFDSLVRRDLGRLEETDDPAAEMPRQDLVYGVTAGLLAGGAIMGLPFHLSFVLGMSRKADCW